MPWTLTEWDRVFFFFQDMNVHSDNFSPGASGVRGTLLYKLYRVCAAPKGMVFEPMQAFSLKTGIDFAHYGLQ